MKKIIAGIDGSKISDDVCNAAIWAAKHLHKPLLFIHTIEREIQQETNDLTGAIGLGARSALLDEMVKQDEQKSKIAVQLGKELIGAACNKAKEKGIEEVEGKQRHGLLLENLIELENDALLMLVGRSGEKTQNQLSALGSHIENLIRTIRTPLALIANNFTPPQNFMLAYDGRTSADNAIEAIIRNDLLKTMPCHLVTIKNNESKQKDKFLQTEERLKNAGFTVISAFLEGSISDSLNRYQQENKIEMLVMGAFAHSKIRQFFLGSNTMRMIDSCQGPLILFR